MPLKSHHLNVGQPRGHFHHRSEARSEERQTLLPRVEAFAETSVLPQHRNDAITHLAQSVAISGNQWQPRGNPRQLPQHRNDAIAHVRIVQIATEDASVNESIRALDERLQQEHRGDEKLLWQSVAISGTRWHSAARGGTRRHAAARSESTAGMKHSCAPQHPPTHTKNARLPTAHTRGSCSSL